MNEVLTFNFLEGNSREFYSNFVTGLDQQHVSEFHAEMETPKHDMYYGFDSRLHNGKVKFYTENLNQDILAKSLNILEKSLKNLPEFELVIEALGKSCFVSEKDDLRKTINSYFLNSIIYNPETKSYFVFEMKDLKENFEIKNYKDLEIQFFKSKYLESFSKFPKLLALFGKSKVLELLNKFDNKLSEDFIKALFLEYPTDFYIDSEEEFLFAFSSPLFLENFGQLKSISGIDALEKYGIDVLEESTEKGQTEIA